jgi:hypothetical protein
LNIPLENLILIGNSLGSAPSIHLAKHEKYNKVSGVVLLSPIGSGIKLVNPKGKLTKEELDKYDCFCNLNKVKEVYCPIFIIHGLKDEVIPHKQSIEMSARIRFLYQWYPRHGNHNNILFLYRYKFFTKLKIFFEHIKHFYTKKNKFDIDSSKVTKFNYNLQENYLENEFSVSMQKYSKLNCEEEKLPSKKISENTMTSNIKAFSTNQDFNLLYTEHEHAKRNPFKSSGQENFMIEETYLDKMSLVNIKSEEIEEEYRIYQKKFNGII